MTFEIPIIKLSGNHRQIGQQHGEIFRERIHAFLDDRLCRLNAILPSPVDMAMLSKNLVKYAKVIRECLPGLSEELCGLAEGANIQFDEALILQLRRELTGFSRMQISGDCTTFAVGNGVDTTIAQTVDLNGNMQDQLSVLHVNLNSFASSKTILLVSFTGLLGYLGMNSHGLAIGLNLVLGGMWEPGIPGYMAIRYLLDCASSVDEAIAILSTLPLASSRSLTLCDGNRKVIVEYILGELHFIEEKTLIHANHFIHKEFQARDELNPLAAVFSRQREQACRNLIESSFFPQTPESCLVILNTPPIYVAPSSNISREETVVMIVMCPVSGMMWLRQPGSQTVQTISIIPGNGEITTDSRFFIEKG